MINDLLMKAEIFVCLAFMFLFFAIQWGKTMDTDPENQKDKPVEEQLKHYKFRTSQLMDSLNLLRGKYESDSSKYQDNPPIIILSENNENHRFELGSAIVPEDLRNELEKKIIPELGKWSEQYNCNAIMIIGHTDGVELSRKSSNLDSYINESVDDDEVNSLKAGSNMDLGIMRAISVMNVLRKQKNGTLSRIRYWLPYSAGQLINEKDSIITEYDGKESKIRRKIEIILHKHDKRTY